MVWDNSTRAELSDFLDAMCNHKESINLETIGLTFSSHRNELIVGNIFIRVFNEQPHYIIKVKLDLNLFQCTYLNKLKIFFRILKGFYRIS